MQKKLKKSLSLCMSLAIAASALPYAGLSSWDGTVNVSNNKDSKSSFSGAASASEKTQEVFSYMTVEKGAKTFSADGKFVGKNYGGFSINENNKIEVEVDGRSLSLKEAEKEIGIQVIYDKNGSPVITSPFQTARLIVKSDKDFDSLGAISCEEKFGGLYLLSYENSSKAYKAYQELSENEDIDYVEPDLVCQTFENSEEDEKGKIKSWGVDKIGTDEFCDRLNEEVGELPEIKVAVIDTGIYAEHNQFKGRILDGGMNFATGYGNEPIDGHGHGSHCAGIICSATNDNVKILPVKVLGDDGSGSLMDIYCGMMYAVEQDVDVMSISLGGYGKSNLIDEAVNAAREKGITVCVAAGNETMNVTEMYSSLASVEDCVVVSSVDSDLNLSYFSCFGPSVDFAAPGENIKSVAITGEDDSVSWDGTSMATPFVAAAFADVLSYDINFTSDQAYEYIKANTLDIYDEGFDDESGWGFINLKNFHFSEQRIDTPRVMPVFDEELPEGEEAEGEEIAEGEEVADEEINELTELNVIITCATEGADVYYTLDGSKPTVENGIKYNGETLTLTESTRIRAIAVLGDLVSFEFNDYFMVGTEETLQAFCVEDGVLTSYRGGLETIDLAELVEKGELPEITEIGSSAFKGNLALKEIILPSSVKTISAEAFRYCSALEKITADAEVIGDNAFEGCYALTEFADDSIVSIGNNAFFECEALTEFNGKALTVIPDTAFYCCSSLTEASFDFSKVVKFGEGALYMTNIAGDVDISNAESIGIYAFARTSISSIKFSETLTALPMGILMGCNFVNSISAPAVTEIGAKSLALEKAGFYESEKVSCDIAFDKVTEVGVNAFNGFVFSDAVSFDSLNEETVLNAFAGAYGKAISLPTITFAHSITFDEETGEEYTTEFNVQALYLENVTFINYDAIGSGKVIVLGPEIDTTNLESIPYDAVVATREWSDEIAEACAEMERTYSTLPCGYVSGDRFVFTKDQLGCIDAFVVGEGCTAQILCGEDVIEADCQGEAYFNTSEVGTKTYSFVVYNADNEAISARDIEVEVVDVERDVIKSDELVLIPAGDNFEKTQDRIYYSFTPEMSGMYTINANGVDIEVIDNEECIAYASADDYCELSLEFEAGKTYEIRVIGDYEGTYGLYVAEYPFMVYLSIDSEDSGRKCITPLNDAYTISFDGFDGSEEYKPEISIYDYRNEYELVEGVDYVFETEDPLDFGYNYYTIVGIGDYYGTLDQDYVYIAPFVHLDEEFEINASEEECVRFVPEKTGVYNIVTKPTADSIERAIKNGCTANDFTPEVAVLKKSYMELMGFELEALEDIGPFMGYGLNSTYSSDDSVISIELEEGEEYYICSLESPAVSVITEGDTISDCTVDYTVNYEYTGKPVVPEVTVTGKNGEALVEGKDYNFTYWNNEEVGVMFGYVEGITFAGAAPLAMGVSDGILSIGELEGDKVVDVDTNYQFKAISGVPYRFVLDETSYLDLEEINLYIPVEEPTFPEEEYEEPSDGNIIYSVKEADEAPEMPADEAPEMPADEPSDGDANVDDEYIDEVNRGTHAEIYGIENISMYTAFAGDSESTILPAGSYIAIFDMGAALSADVKLTTKPVGKHLMNAIITFTDITNDDGEVTDIDITVVYDGTVLERDVDYELYYESLEDPGAFAYTITGIGDYEGTVDSVYIAHEEEAPAEHGVFVDGTNEVTLEGSSANFIDSTEQYFDWTPEKDVYRVSTKSYKEFGVKIEDENGEMIFGQYVNMKKSGVINVEAGKTYTVSVFGYIDATVDVTFTSEKFIEGCAVEFDKLIPLTGERTAPKVTFTDGDYVLKEGVDYKVLTDCYVEDLGLRECVYAGIGDYVGEVTIPVIGYYEDRPEGNYVSIKPGFTSLVAEEKVSGVRKYFKVTNDRSTDIDYTASVYAYLGGGAERSVIFAYGEDGKFIGINDDVTNFTLKPGETRYLLVVNPYVYDDSESYFDSIAYFSLNVAKKEAETTTTTEAVTTSTTTTNITSTGTVVEGITTTASVVGTDEASVGTTADAGASEVTTTTAGGEETTTAPTTTEPTTTEPVIEYVLGDTNGDGIVDASDASAVLVEYAAASTGKDSTFNEAQKLAADVNKDGTVDASDASFILMFYAYNSTGGTENDMAVWMEDKLNK